MNLASQPEQSAMSGLRQATVDDFNRIAALERACFGASEGEFSPRQLRALLRNPNVFWLIGVDADAVACWLKAGNGRKRWARLYSLAVHPGLRGQGWGERLILAGFAWMARNGLDVCRAEVKQNNTAARRLYAGLGFQEIAVLPHYYEPKHHGVRLIKRLNPTTASSSKIDVAIGK